MIYVIGYLIIALIFMPFLGRACAGIYEQKGRSASQVSPITFAITYGILWPIVVVGLGVESIMDRVSFAWLRKFLTGTDRKF